MTHRHIAIFTMFGNGHVLPVLPLCAALVQRGHRITYPTIELYSERIRATGARPIIIKTLAIDKEVHDDINRRLALPTNDPKWWELGPIWTHHLRFIEDFFSQVKGFYEESAPDLVLYDRYSLVGRLVANLSLCPAVQISPTFAYYNSLAIRQNGVCLNPAPVFEYAELLDQFLSAYGISTKRNFWHTEETNLHFIPEAFQYHGDSFDNRFCFVGSLLNRPFKRCWADRSDGRPIILVSDISGLHGMTVESATYFKEFVDALSDTEYYCILSVGNDVVERMLNPLPRYVEVNRCASHLEILPHAALAVCNAGMGSTLEALYNGVPVLAVPLTPWTDEIGYRVEELGLGTCVSRNRLAADKIRSTVQDMLRNHTLSSNVKAIQRVFHHSGGLEAAIDRIERVLEPA